MTERAREKTETISKFYIFAICPLTAPGTPNDALHHLRTPVAELPHRGEPKVSLSAKINRTERCGFAVCVVS